MTSGYAEVGVIALTKKSIIDDLGQIINSLSPTELVRGLAWCLRNFAGALVTIGINRLTKNI